MSIREMELRAAVFVTVVMAACQHTPPPPLPPAAPQQVETGSTFTLLTPLTFPTGRSELLFQGQRQVTADAASKNLPYCKLVPQTGAAGVLAPGSFRVSNVSYDERESGNSSAMFSLTRIVLVSSANQSSYTLTCGWPAATTGPAFLNTEQINSAIGGQFTMQLLR